MVTHIKYLPERFNKWSDKCPSTSIMVSHFSVLVSHTKWNIEPEVERSLYVHLHNSGVHTTVLFKYYKLVQSLMSPTATGDCMLKKKLYSCNNTTKSRIQIFITSLCFTQRKSTRGLTEVQRSKSKSWMNFN